MYFQGDPIDLHALIYWPAIIVTGFGDIFESVSDKCIHAKRILRNIAYMVEETRGKCWKLTDHSRIDKILFRYQLIVTILKKFMDIGSKGNYSFLQTDNHFSLYYINYRRFQLSIFISAINNISNILRHWVETTISPRKLDVLIQISYRISLVLQSPSHRQKFS